MAITRPIRSLLAGGFAAALALGAAGCSVYPSSPVEPAFDTDVLPIFQAHCTRCHDNNPDGGLNHAAYRPAANGGPIPAGAPALTVFGPCYPSDGGAPTCYGVAQWGRQIEADIHSEDDKKRMPLPPARPLDEWEMTVIDAWVAQKPIPICSKSAHPDPALLCP